MQADLDVALLYGIMERLGELRAAFPKIAQTADFLNLVPGAESGDEVRKILLRHVQFLKGVGLVDAGGTMDYGVSPQLTARGQMFVQSELAEFVERPLLSPVLAAIEAQIQRSAQPEEEKAGMLFKLRKAAADRATDLLAKIIVEVGAKIAGGTFG